MTETDNAVKAERVNKLSLYLTEAATMRGFAVNEVMSACFQILTVQTVLDCRKKARSAVARCIAVEIAAMQLHCRTFGMRQNLKAGRECETPSDPNQSMQFNVAQLADMFGMCAVNGRFGLQSVIGACFQLITDQMNLQHEHNGDLDAFFAGVEVAGGAVVELARMHRQKLANLCDAAAANEQPI